MLQFNYMWQLFTLGGLVLEETQHVVDKIIVVADKKLDILVASFYRNLVYFLIALLSGLTGIFGNMSLLLNWPILLVGTLGVGSGITYTYLLQKIELTGYVAISYVTPFLFLFVDVFLLKAPLLLLCLLYPAQQLFKLKAEEDFKKTSLLQKIIATILLLAGAWLTS